jgi:hypothetical protein
MTNRMNRSTIPTSTGFAGSVHVWTSQETPINSCSECYDAARPANIVIVYLLQI